MLKKFYSFILVLIAFSSLIYLLSFCDFNFNYFANFFNFKDKTNINSPTTLSSLQHFKPSPTPTMKNFSLIVGGDLMFDRHIRSHAEKKGNYDFVYEPNLSNLLQSVDYVLANLEGPITLEQSVSQYSTPGGPGNYTFTFSPEIIPVLQKNNLTLLNLGNNHILNFGQKGLLSTRQYLTAAGLNYFGDVGLADNQQRFYLLELFGQKIAFLSYNQFVEGAKNSTLTDITSAKNQQANLILLFCHWGNEYVPEANSVIVNLAHEFIDAGVDLIVGGHPHVIQNNEIYQGKSIYYSLGNFVFDQYFSAAVQEGLLLKIDFTYDISAMTWSYLIKEHRVQMNQNGVTSLLIAQ